MERFLTLLVRGEATPFHFSSAALLICKTKLSHNSLFVDLVSHLCIAEWILDNSFWFSWCFLVWWFFLFSFLLLFFVCLFFHFLFWGFLGILGIFLDWGFLVLFFFFSWGVFKNLLFFAWFYSLTVEWFSHCTEVWAVWVWAYKCCLKSLDSFFSMHVHMHVLCSSPFFLALQILMDYAWSIVWS